MLAQVRTLDPLAGISAFLAVAEHGGFSAAAAHLGMSRATVGQQVGALEARLGVRLFQRSTRALVLSEAGRAYRAALDGVVPQLRAAEQVAGSFQAEPVGRLRVAAPPDLGPHHLAPVVARFLAAHPSVSVELELSTDPVDVVGQGFDLAVRGALAVEPTLVTRRIGTSPLVACAAPAYLARHGVPERPEDLARHACLHFSRLRWGQSWHFARGEDTVRVPVQPRLLANDGPTLLAAALAGAGVALEPAFVVGPALRDGRLVPLLPGWTLPEVPLHAVYPASRQVARKVRSFVAMLAADFAAHPDLKG